MKKIGFFGGCFNPPSNVHINLANNLIENKIVDEVIFIPMGDYYNKKNLEKAEHRLNMINLSIKDYDLLSVDDIETKINENLCAADAFEIICKKYDKSRVLFIMGSDNFNNMKNWKNYEEIKNKYNYIVIERENCNLERCKSYVKENVTYFFPNKRQAFNSTLIRERIKENKEVKNMLNKEVLKYIIKNNLYTN